MGSPSNSSIDNEVKIFNSIQELCSKPDVTPLQALSGVAGALGWVIANINLTIPELPAEELAMKWIKSGKDATTDKVMKENASA